MYTLYQSKENRLATNTGEGTPVFTAKTEIQVFDMLEKLAKSGAIYLEDLTVKSRMEANTMIELIKDIEEKEIRKKLYEMLAPLKIAI